MRTVLIATTNAGKYRELSSLLRDLPIKTISLNELSEKIPAPDETEETIEGNAILKAKYYAQKSGHITIADDVGLFIDALGGWPGVKSARIADDSTAQTDMVLQKMETVTDENRTAYFEGVSALYDPKNHDLFVSTGRTKGTILKEKRGKNGFGYDSIFHVAEAGKTYAEMREEEKNDISHRGRAVHGIRRYILNIYGGEHFTIPIGVIIKNGKVLLNKRNDTEKPELHGLWEFPGGKMEIGETIEENLVREIREECGYTVEIISQLRMTWTVKIPNPRSTHYGIQIYLLPFVCRIIEGDGVIGEEEVMETAWVSPEQVNTYNLIGENRKMYEKIYFELTETIKNHNL